MKYIITDDQIKRFHLDSYIIPESLTMTAAEEIRFNPISQGRKIITLCGSVKFWDEYTRWNAQLTLEGNIVFSCGLSLKEGYEDLICDLPLDDVKKDLDQIHLWKINLSDEIFVLNVGGYIGDSTKREIEYAKSKGKMVKYLEPKYAFA